MTFENVFFFPEKKEKQSIEKSEGRKSCILRKREIEN